MHNLYLFRHGQTNENMSGVRYGAASRGYLSPLGILQATELAQKLADKKLDVFITSPYHRAVHTAVIVGHNHSEAPIITDERLCEATFYHTDNPTPNEAAELNNVLLRVKAVLDDILKTNYENIAIVSHGGITRAILAVCGYKINDIENADCFHLMGTNNNWQLINDISQ